MSEVVIESSRKPPRIILTEDKDFGEWVFAHKVRGISVLFLQYHFKETEAMRQILTQLLSERAYGINRQLYDRNDSKNQNSANRLIQRKTPKVVQGSLF